MSCTTQNRSAPRNKNTLNTKKTEKKDAFWLDVSLWGSKGSWAYIRYGPTEGGTEYWNTGFGSWPCRFWQSQLAPYPHYDTLTCTIRGTASVVPALWTSICVVQQWSLALWAWEGAAVGGMKTSWKHNREPLAFLWARQVSPGHPAALELQCEPLTSFGKSLC